MNNIECEITYLAKYLPENYEKSSSRLIVDIYFPRNREHPTLRLRQKGKKYQLTKKQKIKRNDASVHSEVTIDLSKEEFEAIAKGEGKSLSKRRYLYNYKGVTAEIDLFKESLQGLVLIEFEFKSKEELEGFEMPDFCLADVTQENFIAGGILAGKSLQDILVNLNKFNYKEIKVPS